MSAIEMRKIMESIHLVEDNDGEVERMYADFKRQGPAEDQSLDSLRYWHEEFMDEYNRQNTRGNPQSAQKAMAFFNEIDVELDNRHSYAADQMDPYDDPHGDYDKSPEELAGEQFQDKYDMYRNEY